VATAYGKFIQGQSGGCGRGSQQGSCGGRAEAIGYSREDLSSVPEGVEAPTFGCGNPLAFSEVREGQTVVDLGSGAGLDLLIAAERVGPSGHVIGVDMTEEMIDRARRNVAAAGHANVEVRPGLIEDLPVESGTVDWVISNCVINLSPEKERVFAEIARVLKPGGRMLVSDIVATDLPQWVRESAAALGACLGGAISEGEYLAGLRAAGLTEVAVRARHDYSAAELAGFMSSSEVVREALGGDCGCGGEEAAGRVSEELAGKVASIKVFARKPGASD
jgi:SAM-dependent methyltransferase